MKVLSLRCQHGHGFEGWFGSEDDYRSQAERGLIECPICGDGQITRLPTAARLNRLPSREARDHRDPREGTASAPNRHHHAHPGRGEPLPGVAADGGAANGSTIGSGGAAAQAAGTSVSVVTTPEQQSVEALWMKAVRHVMANTHDVGERFADEARRIHYGETPHRSIRGQATVEQTEALRDEGIEVYTLALPKALKGPLQ